MADDTLDIEFGFNVDENQIKKDLDSTLAVVQNKFSTAFDKINASLKLTGNTKELDKTIANIDTKITKLTTSREILLKAEQTPETKKVLENLETRLEELQKEKQINITLKNASTKSLTAINKQIKELTAEKHKIEMTADLTKPNKELDKINKELEILTKTKELKIEMNQNSYNKVNKALNVIGSVGAAAFASLTAAIGAAGVGLYKLADIASTAEESTSKLYNVFSNLEQSKVDEKINELTKSYGMSSLAAKQFLGNTGDLLVGLGMAEDKALDLSSTVQKMATDISSFQNIDFTRTSEALTAITLGQYQRAEALGILINKEMINNELRAKGMDKLTGLALKQAEAEIGIQLAMEQSAKAMGDYARTEEGFENQRRLTNNLLQELAVVIGSEVLPKFAGLQKAVNDAIIEFTDFIQTNDEFINSVVTLSEKVTDFIKNGIEVVIKYLPTIIGFISSLVENIDKVISILVGLTAAFVAAKVALMLFNAQLITFNAMTGGIILAIGILVASLVQLGLILAKNKDKTKDLVKSSQDYTTEAKAQNEANQKNAKALKEQGEAADKLTKSFDKLATNTKKTVAEQKKMNDIGEELKKLYPDLELMYDRNGDIVGYNVEQYDALRKAENLSTEAAQKHTVENLKGSIKRMKALQKELDNEIKLKIEQKAKAQVVENYSGSGDLREQVLDITASSDFRDANKALEILNEALKSNQIETSKLEAELAGMEKELANFNNTATKTAEKPILNTTITTTGTDEAKKEIEKTLDELLIKNDNHYNKLIDIAKIKHEKEIELGLTSKADEQRRLQELEDLERESLDTRLDLLNDFASKLDNGADIASITVSKEASIGIDDDGLAEGMRTVAEEIASTQKQYEKFAKGVKKESANIWQSISGAFGSGTLSPFMSEINSLGEAMGELANTTEKTTEQMKEDLDKVIITATALAVSFADEVWSAVVDLQNAILDTELQELEIKYDSDTKALEDEYDKATELRDEKYESDIEAYEAYLEALEEAQAEYNERIDEMEAERDDLESEKLKIMSKEEYLALQQQIDDKEAQIAEEKALLAESEQNYNDTLDAQAQAETDYNAASLLAQEEYEKELEALEQEYAIKQAELEYKQAENSRNLSYFQAVISMAQGIAAAVTAGMSFGPAAVVMVPILTAMAATLGALQIATIANTPMPTIPTFASGGLITGEHSGNYKAFGLDKPNATDDTLAFVGTGERILTPHENTLWEMFRNQQAINQSQYEYAYDNSNMNNITENNYSISVNMSASKSTPKQVAKVVMKAIAGKL